MEHHSRLRTITWKSQNPNIIIGAEANSTFAWNNEGFAGDNPTEYQLIPATEPVVVEGGNGGVTYEFADEYSYMNSFPPGYRFKPLDSELIDVYLAGRVQRRPLPPNKIHEVKLYMFNPDVLAESYEPAGDNEWYFFTPRDRKYKNGQRPNRAAGNGYWKATGADRAVKLGSRKIGSKKSLVYYTGKSLRGTKTDWIMHEFSFEGAPKIASGGNDMLLDECVLCRLHRKPTSREVSPVTTPTRDDDEQKKQKKKQKKQKQNEQEADAPLPGEANHNNLQQFQHNLPTLLPTEPHQQGPYMYNYDMGLQNGSQFQITNYPDGVIQLLGNNLFDIPDELLISVYPDLRRHLFQHHQINGLDWNPHQTVNYQQVPPPQPTPPRNDDHCDDQGPDQK